eukprot:11216785-Lingulodinium_polyedra.AAC.1
MFDACRVRGDIAETINAVVDKASGEVLDLGFVWKGVTPERNHAAMRAPAMAALCVPASCWNCLRLA